MKKKVIELSVSLNHSAFVVAGGYVLTMGDNKDGQLGLGHTKHAISEPSIVRKIGDKFVTVKMCNNLSSPKKKRISFYLNRT